MANGEECRQIKTIDSVIRHKIICLGYGFCATSELIQNYSGKGGHNGLEIELQYFVFAALL